MSEEIEYLTEEELEQARQASIIVNDFLVYFDKSTGSILSVTNEERRDLESFVKMPYDDVKQFLEGKSNFNDFKIVLEKNELVLVNTNEELKADINFNSLAIVPLATKDVSLVIENHVDVKHWAFFLRPDVIHKLEKQNLDVALDFHIYVNKNKNFHIRTISFKLADLLSVNKHFIPHLSPIESEKEKITILTKHFFDTYGVRTVNESKI